MRLSILTGDGNATFMPDGVAREVDQVAKPTFQSQFYNKSNLFITNHQIC